MRTMVSGLLVACLAVGTSACGGESADPAPRAGDPTTAASGSPTPSESPSSGVEPASGESRTLGNLTLRFPRGYDVSRLGPLAMTGTGPDLQFLGVLAVRSSGSASLDRLVRDALTDVAFTGRAVRHDDLEADGVPLYHVSGPVGAGRTRDLVGAEHGGYRVELQFTTALREPARRELIASVLAAMEWS